MSWRRNRNGRKEELASGILKCRFYFDYGVSIHELFTVFESGGQSEGIGHCDFILRDYLLYIETSKAQRLPPQLQRILQ